jgi:hypothetical protein
MGRHIAAILRFVAASVFCAAVGGVALMFLNYDLAPAQKANDVRLDIARLKQMGAAVEKFLGAHDRLPTDSEITCDFAPCRGATLIVWHAAWEPDGTFSLVHTSLGVPFTPVETTRTTWYSRDGTTDRDGYDQPWRWQVRYFLIASVDVGVILLPWLVLLVLWIRRQRQQPATS